VGKTTAAALNFAAMTAQAARVFRDVDKIFASRCLAAAARAWQWAIKNPSRFYRNPKDIDTGEYHDEDLSQELFWAASELLITTGDDGYRANVEKHLEKVINEKTANWNNSVDELGCFSLAAVKNLQSPIGAVLRKKAISVIHRLADNILNEIQTNPYRIPHSEFEWGSNGDMAYDGMILAYAYYHTGKRKYLEAVVETVDYLFGKNAVGYSFITGFGDKTPRNIHHRPSGADGIVEPIPGFLVGGPNWERQDSIGKNKKYGVKYPFKEAAKSYVDLTKSFASNEVCINWNAPLIFLLGFLETSAN
jgi:endoglucanase